MPTLPLFVGLQHWRALRIYIIRTLGCLSGGLFLVLKLSMRGGFRFKRDADIYVTL